MLKAPKFDGLDDGRLTAENPKAKAIWWYR
jgi:hypothetical protein